MKKIFLMLAVIMTAVGAQALNWNELNNPKDQNGYYIVKWDCANNRFASSNDFEADETFTFAVDVTNTPWVDWLKGENGRGICTNFALSGSGAQDIARNGDRLYHITGNIYGKTINIAQLATSWNTPGKGSQTAIHSNLFGFNPNKDEWWQNPSEDVTGGKDCFFKTAAYTGTHKCPDFYTNDFDGNIYNWINQKGYAVPCAVASPCYQQQGDDDDDDDDEEEQGGGDVPVIAGSQAWQFGTDNQQRGYYDRPYQRYEAEPNSCASDGTFLTASDDQKTIQSEASHQVAVQLIKQNSYVAWKIDKAGDGLTVRFCLPDDNSGNGTKGKIAIYANTDKVGELELNSWWAWQYCSGTYPDNNPNNGPVKRMKFDEMHLRLSRTVQGGEVLKVVKIDNNQTPYTIDFVELEPTVKTAKPANAVQFDGGNLQQFINNHQGQVIYVPEGTYNLGSYIDINGNGTQLIGAGMWYTTLYFNQYGNRDKRHIYTNNSNVRMEGFYINAYNNQRYVDNNPNNGTGKGFEGSWGNNSVIKNCWVEHFECGAWIANYGGGAGSGLKVEHCRFRNNYADGFNCAHGTSNATISHCSFRNNGDDDMASWTDGNTCNNNTFEYCTCENNWRASSLGFFGGGGHVGHHLYIVDALESGVRVNSDFGGNGFTGSTIHFHDITIQHCGCKYGGAGKKGTDGDIIGGNMQGAFSIGNTRLYSIKNVKVEDVDIIDSRENSLVFDGYNGNQIENAEIINVHLLNAPCGVYFVNNPKGWSSYCNLTFNNIRTMYGGNKEMSWTENFNCTKHDYTDDEQVQAQPDEQLNAPQRFFLNGRLVIRVHGGLYDIMGNKVN